MAKRSPSEEGEDSQLLDDDCKPSTAKRSRLIEYEPVRLVSVSGVNDIEERVDRFKLYKLAERIRYKERLLADEKEKVRRLTARQDRDDNTLCTLNRHWNRLDAELRIMLELNGGSNSSGEGADEGGEGGTSNDFLTQLAQMDDEECERTYDARVTYSLKLASQLSQSEVARAEKFHTLSKNLNNFIQGGGEDVKGVLVADLTSKLETLTEENVTLRRVTDKMQMQHREIGLKMKEKEDRIALLETKNEELMTQLEEKDFDMKKCLLTVSKLEHRLHEMETTKKSYRQEMGVVKKEWKENGVHADHASSADPHSAHKVDELSSELESCKETLRSRLQEMNELNERNAELVGEVEKLKIDLKLIPSEVIKASEEYMNLQAFYTIMVDEVSRVKAEKETQASHIEEMKKKHAEQLQAMEREQELSQKELLKNNTDVEAQLSKIKEDYQNLRVEFDQIGAINEIQAQAAEVPNSFDRLAAIQQMKGQLSLVRSDCSKFRAKWKMAVGALAKAQSERDEDRRQLERFLLLPLSDDDCRLLNVGVKQKEDGKGQGGQRGGGTEGGGAMERENNPPATSTPPSDNGIVKHSDDVKRLRVERDAALKKLSELLKVEERKKLWGEEANRRMTNLEAKVEEMKKELDQKRAEEEGLMAEMESTGTAFEELQEENSKLIVSLKESEDQHLKVMSDRIFMNHTQQKMKEEKATLDEEVLTLTNTVDAIKLELRSCQEQRELLDKRLLALAAERERMLASYDCLRKLQLSETKKVHDMTVLVKKCNNQLHETQQTLKSKLGAHEKDEYRIRRLEEERSILKKRLERAKKSELIGSSDAVLLEEIKELRDVLTCPSCKVRRKDGILTKCFHVFCMECIKTRYETRRRKCPKCNAAFGANDFHRVYIG